MIKVLFVCHGNICRSPMTEFIFKDMVRKIGREKEFVIASSATSTEEIWSRNVTNTMQIFGSDPENKVRKLLKNKDVSDPWYTNKFDVAYNYILEGCCQILESL